MSVSGISSTTYPLYAPNQQNPVQQSFSQLMQAIQSGNLQAAQQAYATLAQNAPQTPNGAFGEAISQIGAALSSGNIVQAQATLQSFQSQMQTHRGGHHHHHGAAQNASTSISTTSLASSLGTPVDPTEDAGGNDASVNLLA